MQHFIKQLYLPVEMHPRRNMRGVQALENVDGQISIPVALGLIFEFMKYDDMLATQSLNIMP